MSDTVLKLYGVESAGCSYESPNTNFGSSSTVSYGSGDKLYIKLENFPDEYKYRAITNLTPYVYATGFHIDYSSARGTITFGAVREAFDVDTVTYATRPNDSEINDATIYHDDIPAYITVYPENDIDLIRAIFQYGLLADAGSNLVLGTTRYSKKPYVEVRISDSNLVPSIIDLDTRYGANAAAQTIFKWRIWADADSFADVTLVSATLQWRVSGGTTINSVTALSEKECVVSAGTFPVGKIDVRITGTTNAGDTVTGDWTEFTVRGPAVRDMSPASGYAAKNAPTVFSWDITQQTAKYDSNVYVSVPQTAATFRWRSSATGAVNEISIAGSTKSLTVPSGTFTTDEIQWQIVATAEGGYTVTSNWATLSTVEVTSAAKVLSPQNTVVDGATDTLFQWAHIIETNTAQTKADLQKSADGNTWETLATVTGAETQWLCEAGTLTTAVKYWRVRTYNTDNVAGDWSDAAQIVVIAAPTAPSIQIKSTGPRPSISWQTSEQEAYQVELDGKLSGGTHYGTDKTWTSPAYLADGSHTARVRVQNQYGMWSDWGAAALPVTNTPGSAITLSVQASSVADLSWQTSGSYDFYLVYRNGKPIAKLTQTQYTDELSSGSTTYQVRGCYDSSGNYGISQAVTVDVRAGVHQVSDLDTGLTLRLPYSDSQHRQTTRTVSRQVELLQLSGAYYPVAVEVDSDTDSLSITAALTDEAQVRQLMNLVGKLVCAKTPQGDMVIGYITSLPKQHDGFLNVFNFTVEQIDYDDEVTL